MLPFQVTIHLTPLVLAQQLRKRQVFIGILQMASRYLTKSLSYREIRYRISKDPMERIALA